MPDTDPKLQPNPTRLPDAVLPQPEVPDRLTNDPEFAPALLASEEDSVRSYAKRVAPPKLPAGRLDARLRPLASIAVAVWIGALATAAILRKIRRSSK